MEGRFPTSDVLLAAYRLTSDRCWLCLELVGWRGLSFELMRFNREMNAENESVSCITVRREPNSSQGEHCLQHGREVGFLIIIALAQVPWSFHH